MVNFAQYGTVDYANQVADKLSGFNLPENIAARRNVQIGQQSNEMKLRQMQQQEQERAMAFQEKELAKQAWQAAVQEGQATGKSPLEIYQSKRAQVSPDDAMALEEMRQRQAKANMPMIQEGQMIKRTPEGGFVAEPIPGFRSEKLETQKQLAQEKLAAQREAAQMRVDQMREAARERFAQQQNMARLAASLRQPNGEQRKPMTADQEAKYRQKFGEAYGSTLTALQSSANVVDTANKLKEHPGLKGMSGLAGYLPNMPGGDAAAAYQIFETLQGKITKMAKDAAASSGALGPMAVQEWKILRDQITAIDPTKLSPEQMKDVIDDLVIQARNAERITEESYMSTFGPDFEQYPQFADPRGAMPNASAPKGDLRSRADAILKGK